MKTMKALTIWQPWASLLACGAKKYETRSWATKYKGQIAIHAAIKQFDTNTYFDRELYAFADALNIPDIYSFNTLSYGCVTVYGIDYQIVDIHMRMLQPHELFKAQGFPDNYIIDRDDQGRPYPKSKQTARCGNAVTPPVPAALVRANLPEMCKKEEAVC